MFMDISRIIIVLGRNQYMLQCCHDSEILMNIDRAKSIFGSSLRSKPINKVHFSSHAVPKRMSVTVYSDVNWKESSEH